MRQCKWKNVGYLGSIMKNCILQWNKESVYQIKKAAYLLNTLIIIKLLGFLVLSLFIFEKDGHGMVTVKEIAIQICPH